VELLDAAARARNLRAMARDELDVLVIGGGITGAGVALDAAARGYRVALVEKGDFASATSSRSTKLVHGGIRYLPQLDFPLVHEALAEQKRLLRNAAYLVRPLTFVLPLYRGARRPVGVPFAPPYGIGLGQILDAGLWLYDGLAGRLGRAHHRHITADEALALAPSLRMEGLRSAYLYTDAQTNDTSLTLAVLRTAAQHGAALANYAEVTGFIRRDGEPTARVNGAIVRDVPSGDRIMVRARHVVNATGIFAEQVERLTGDEARVRIEPSKGVHLVVDRARAGLREMAVVIPETEDERILFVVPWGERALIGTTDTGSGDLDDPTATPDDIAYLLRHVNRVLDRELTAADILSVYAGYRPLVRTNAGATARLSRTHEVLEHPTNGLVTIVGGKLTTYRLMAQQVVDRLAARDGLPATHPTERLVLAGAVDWPEAREQLHRRAHDLGLAEDVIEHLAFNYGRDANIVLDIAAEHQRDIAVEDRSLIERIVPDLPYLRAEVVYAVRYAMAQRLEDVLARRTRISIEDGARGTKVALDVARLMADEFGWSDERLRAEVADYAAAVQRHLAAEGLARPQSGAALPIRGAAPPLPPGEGAGG
jgi:glycerol-3-phosphate dehydrogenase